MAAPVASLTTWQGLRNLLLIGGLAIAAAVAAAILAEGQYARPLCQAYGAERQLTYLRFQYPPANPTGIGSAGSSCYCIFSNGTAATVDVNFERVAPSYVTYLLVRVATTIGLTVPIFFVVFALALVQIYGAMGIKLRPDAAAKADSLR